MDTIAAIKTALDMADMISMSYLNDLTDEEMMTRPTPEANHIKWQVGHLIVSENNMVGLSLPGAMPALPEGFSDRYTKEQAKIDDVAAFDSKETLMQLYQTQRMATKAALETMTTDSLDAETPEDIRHYAPTVGVAFVMQNTHWMMHAGQWAVIRRMLGREPLF